MSLVSNKKKHNTHVDKGACLHPYPGKNGTRPGTPPPPAPPPGTPP